ncbi:MAG TPA: hypothetical protein VNN74_07280 [Candidatus Micrarchaeia archaeon]|nr:hypothetical protein [Candidatus Micrarchaeia archaeon]
MGIFGAVPGLTIFAIASVFCMAIAYVAGAALLSFGGTMQRARIAVLTVSILFTLTTVVALLAAIEEGGFATRVTGG